MDPLADMPSNSILQYLVHSGRVLEMEYPLYFDDVLGENGNFGTHWVATRSLYGASYASDPHIVAARTF